MDYKQNRTFLKFNFQYDLIKNEGGNPLADSDQTKGLPPPPMEKPYNEEKLIQLPNPIDIDLKKWDIIDVIDSRESRRIPYSKFTLNELSFILWAVQGVRINNNPKKKRTVPSAGSRYPFDTYFLALDVEGLQKGLYRYIWSKQSIISVPINEGSVEDFERYTTPMGAINIIWVVVPYRCEWRYIQYAHRACALDAGHMAQNGYLAAEALGRGCCAIAGYSQADIDRLLGLDGVNEFTCYIESFM
jgi:SagB-type dehydrogenase family enzyme